MTLFGNATSKNCDKFTNIPAENTILTPAYTTIGIAGTTLSSEDL